MPKDEALKVVRKQVELLDKVFKQELRKFKKVRLIAWLTKEREELALRFLKLPSLEIDKFWSVNALIKKVMEDLDVEGEDEANEKNTSKLIEGYTGYLKYSENYYLIDEGFRRCHQEKNIELDEISEKDLLRNYKFYYDEDYLPILESFGSNLIFDKRAAKEYFDKHKKEYEFILKNGQDPEYRTPSEIIHGCYPIFQTFFSALRRNKSHSDLFDLEYLKKQGISPKFILSLLKEFPQQPGLLTFTEEKDFKTLIRNKFKNVDKEVAYNSLVFKKENQEVFPFFIELEGKLLISFSFVGLMCIFYYPFYYKDLYDKETQKLSDVFEKNTVPEELKRLGYKVISNYEDKKKSSIEIDHIAWKNDKLIVIETKIWDIRPFFEHRRIHEQRERDLKGIVDGKEFTTKKGIRTTKKIPSLIYKIEHVGKNIRDICPDFENIKTISGVVITNFHPILKEYKGIKFIGFSRINEI